VRAPDEQGEGVQQVPVPPDGQHVAPQQLLVQQLLVQQLLVQQLPVQQLVGQQAGLDTGQQPGWTSALLGGEPVGIGQHGMI